jgi:hypothetical protein
MMSSESSTDRGHADSASGFQPWHFYFILSMAGATWAVIASRHTEPMALFLLSATILAAGAAGAAFHYALAGFFGLATHTRAPMTNRRRAELERDKALVLRSIKELEFDHQMKKVSDADFAEIGSRLRTRAMTLIAELDAAPAVESTPAPKPARNAAPAPATVYCTACGAANDADARFCKACGARLR